MEYGRKVKAEVKGFKGSWSFDENDILFLISLIYKFNGLWVFTFLHINCINIIGNISCCPKNSEPAAEGDAVYYPHRCTVKLSNSV